MRRYSQIFGRNRREFPISIFVGVMGCLWWLNAMPAYENHTPLGIRVGRNLQVSGMSFAIGLVSLFCLINAWRDSENTPQSRKGMTIWGALLGFWLFVLMAENLKWLKKVWPLILP